MLEEAGKDPQLYAGTERELLGDRQCLVIVDDNVPVGFYTPKTQSFNGVVHWRAGTLFLVSQARGKGIMHGVLKDFFDTHQPGLSWIADKNAASIHLFTSLGFVKAKAKIAQWGEEGHWWIHPKEKLSIEHIQSAEPVYLKW